ncbi:MAG: hypothetical protein ACOCXG_02375 [Nanoarchaeota archaeon]
MKNLSEKFYLYLLGKKNHFLKKDEINKYYTDFENLWNLKSNFENIFQVLKQQKKIIFIFDKVWKILDEEEWFKLKIGKLEKLDILISYLDYLGINWYFGLSSAKYFQGDWQSLSKLYLINSKFEKKIKMDNLEINLLKIPEKYYIDLAVKVQGNKKYSDLEKTYLDEVYFTLKKKYKGPFLDKDKININTLNLYLRVFDDFKDLRTWILNNVDKDILVKIN